jgi:hypothetical protein
MRLLAQPVAGYAAPKIVLRVGIASQEGGQMEGQVLDAHAGRPPQG